MVNSALCNDIIPMACANNSKATFSVKEDLMQDNRERVLVMNTSFYTNYSDEKFIAEQATAARRRQVNSPNLGISIYMNLAASPPGKAIS